jgi:hypothetical protein
MRGGRDVRGSTHGGGLHFHQQQTEVAQINGKYERQKKYRNEYGVEVFRKENFRPVFLYSFRQ